MVVVSRAAACRLFLRNLALHTAAISLTSESVTAGGLDEVRKAASVLPGYGPPDLLFPGVFLGRWRVSSTVTDVKTPMGDASAPQEYREAIALLNSPPLTFEQRFVATEDGTVIADRAFNAVRRAAAMPGAASLQDLQAKWVSTNPNVLTLTVLSTGSVVETKVTKRAADSPFDGAFGTSEYARIADAGSSGVVSAIPSIKAERVQIRYKWDAATDGAAPARVIEALELREIFDPTATGFADLAGATPVLRVKSRLRLDRIS